jgi:chromatin structure-remodeling complex subunit RSC9
MERGDKYRFESFPGLAEALVEKVLEVCSLFYKVDWQIQYMMEDSSMPGTSIIDGLNGTSEILNKVTTLDKLVIDDNIQTAEFSDALLQIDEAALTLRNMVMLEENAAYVSELHPLRDFLSLALNLPNYDSVVELKHYALDIAEQLTKYLHLGETDPLYLSLLGQLDSDDRGAVLTALRAISRISMNLEENNLLKGVPATAVQKIMDWTLINDEEMVHACLDFLYQYTAVVDNVDFMVSQLPLDPLVNQLTRLLMHNAKIVEKEFAQGREYSTPAPENIAPLPQHALDLMLKLDETERSSMWLRCLFEEDPDEVITQIAFWQAYQTQFAPVQRETGRPLLQASDFIKNVSNTFVDKAQAQLQHLGPGNQRFVIKGLRYRSVPVDANGEEYIKCQWATDSKSGRPCGYFFHTPEEVYKHILLTHMGAEQREDGLFINTTERRYVCLWEKCRRFHDSPVSKLMDLARHIKTHLPPPHAKEAKDTNGTKDLNEYLGAPPAKRRKPSYRVAPKKQAFSYQITQTDERMEAAGIPLSAVLVLRNLARNLAVSKTEPETEKDISWVDKLFKPVEHQLVEVFAHNKSLVSNKFL